MDRKTLAGLGLLAAMSCTPSPSTTPSSSPARGGVVATFTGEADLLRGTLTITSQLEPDGARRIAADAALRPSSVTPYDLVTVPDERPGTRRPNTVEMITDPATVREVPGGCGAVADFEGEITLRSFFAGASLQNAHAELLTLTPSGYEACNSDAPALGLSAAAGLWSYGTLAPAGSPGDSVKRLWKFRLPSNTTNFRFTGRVVADGVAVSCPMLGLPGPPTTILPTVTGGSHQAAAVGDLNGDGASDAVVAYAAAYGGATPNAVAVLLSNGDGTFRPPVTYTAGTDPRDVALADVNQDGKLDIVTANLGSNSVSVLAGVGDGTFGAAVSRPTGASSGPTSLAVGDVTGDAYPEVVVGRSSGPANGVLVYPNSGGTLGAPVSVANGPVSSVLVADLDGNGRGDLAYFARDATSRQVVAVRLNDGSGGFPSEVQYAAPGSISLVALKAGDLTGDDRPELVVANAYQLASTDPTSVLVYTNGGSGAFGAPASYAVAGWVKRLAIGDVSGDGKSDVAATMNDRGTVSVLVNEGAGALLPEVQYEAVPAPSSVGVGDFAADGRLDLLAVSESHRFASVLRNLGGGIFPSRFSAATGATSDSIPVATVAEDLDGDSNEDVLVLYNDSWIPTYVLAVYFGRGDGTFGTAIEYPVAAPGAALATADVDRDGHPDVVVAAGSAVHVYRGSIAGILSAPEAYSTGAFDVASSVAAADVDLDGWPDLVVADSSRAQFEVFRNRGDGTFPASAAIYMTGGAIPRKAVVADFSHDGWPDVVVSTSSGTVERFVNSGTGTFSRVGNIFLSRSPVDLAAADLDADGWPDLAIADFSTQRVLGVLMNAKAAGTVSFLGGVAYPVPSGAALYAVVPGDLDGDGDVDLVAATAYGTAAHYLNSGTGTFPSRLEYPMTLPSAKAIALADVNRDFRLDAVTIESRPVAVPGRVFSAVSSCLP